MSFIAVCVDDIIDFDGDQKSEKQLFANLGESINVEDKSFSVWLFGIKNHVSDKCIKFSQESHGKNLIEKWSFRKCKPVDESVQLTIIF